MNEIFANMLRKNGAEAEGHFGKNPFVLYNWVKRVKKDGDWDLKNNEETIFGVAWSFDHGPSKGESKTTFIYGDMTGNAADFGNYHAGYTGTKAKIPISMQKVGAGVVEQLKMKNYNSFNPQNSWTGPHLFFSKPHHDRQRDYEYNTLGMREASE